MPTVEKPGPVRPQGGKIALLLLSAPDGMDYYRKAGLEKFDNCFGIRRRYPDVKEPR